MPDTVLIIGAGHAGLQTAVSLRQGGFRGNIDIIGDESVFPYQRPPLSKAYLQGDIDKDRMFLKPSEWYQKQDVSFHPCTRIKAVHPKMSIAETDKGQTFEFDHLVFSTGARNRQLPMEGASQSNVFGLRTLADADGLSPYLGPGKKLIIVGAGYIGLETAAAARLLGTDVTVLELADRVLARVTSETVSRFYEVLHKARGVNIKTQSSLAAINHFDGKAKNVTLSTGEVLDCDVLLIGIGITPNIELAIDAGIACEDGILVDSFARTNIPNIYAAGDCAKRLIQPYGHTGRLESVHNAIEQSKQAAAAILERPAPKIDCPWFWSDQYDIKLQIAGLSSGYDKQVIRGSVDDRKFSVFYYRDGTLIAVDAVNSAPEFMVGKRLILQESSPDPKALQDANISMKAIASMYRV